MSAPIRILVIDDEAIVRESCARILGEEGYAVEGADGGQAGLDRLGREGFDLVLLDLKMPGMSGMDVLPQIREGHPRVGVIIVTGYGTIETAVSAIKMGAFDYLCKPFAPEELLGGVRRYLDERVTEAAEPAGPYRIEGIVGSSPPMQELYRLIARVAPTGTTVLIEGESGVGKELVARAIHGNSVRRDQPFVPVDCAGMPETLFEAELFGHAAGAFTGATGAKKGLVEVASPGTLFLDEVANVPLSIQPKLLRVIQEREFRAVGSVHAQRTSFRLVAATNRDLQGMVAQGTFREDLYYRLHVFPIRVPPLRERRQDIPALAHHFLAAAAESQGRSVTRIAAEAMALLAAHDWPGNVRELHNVIEGAVVMTEGDRLLPEHLPATFRDRAAPAGTIPGTGGELRETKKALRAASGDEVERTFVLEALQRAGWNVTRAAEQVGMQRTNLHALMRKHGISIRRPTPSD